MFNVFIMIDSIRPFASCGQLQIVFMSSENTILPGSLCKEIIYVKSRTTFPAITLQRIVLCQEKDRFRHVDFTKNGFMSREGSISAR